MAAIFSVLENGSLRIAADEDGRNALQDAYGGGYTRALALLEEAAREQGFGADGSYAHLKRMEEKGLTRRDGTASPETHARTDVGAAHAAPAPAREAAQRTP